MSDDNKILKALDPVHSTHGKERTDSPPGSVPLPHPSSAPAASPVAGAVSPRSPLPRQDLPMDSDPVCVAATPPRIADEEPFVLEAHEIAGEQCLLVFTSPRLLVEELGRYQPFLIMYMDAAAQAAAQAGVQRVYVDPILPALFPRWDKDSYLQLLAETQAFAQTKKEEASS